MVSAKARADVFKWLAAICGILVIVAVFGGIFLCCWCVKKRRRRKSQVEKYPTGEPKVHTHQPPSPLSRDYTLGEKIPVVESEPKKALVYLSNPGKKESELTYDVFPHPTGREMEFPLSGGFTMNGQPAAYSNSNSTPNRSQDSFKGLVSSV